jgi:hypothetical protein
LLTCHITIPTVVGSVVERFRGKIIIMRRGRGSGGVLLVLMTGVEGIVRG